MKGLMNVMGILVAIVVIVGIILGVVWFERSLRSVATSITVHKVEPGIHCALANTHDGVAMSCYPAKDD